jgi:hypothetical protein
VDLAYAFNSVSRSVLLRIVQHCIPEVYNYVNVSLNIESLLFFGNNTMLSKEGVQQGDPLSPYFFSLVLHSLLLRLAKIPGHFQVWYLDDGVLIGDQQSLILAIQAIELVGPSLGLTLNCSKSEIYPLDEQFNFQTFTDLGLTKIEKLEILGVPLTHFEESLSKDVTRSVEFLFC